MAIGDPLNSTSELAGRDSVDLLARMIFSEAEGESEEGKRGVAFVTANRKAKNTTEFGGGTYEGVILKAGQFSGMSTSRALKPTLTSNAWTDSVNIASNMATKTNPIGTCLWFNTNTMYQSRTRTSGGKEQYTFNSGSTYTDVTEKKIIGNHTFFKLSGY